jgi:hypothetical protein
MKLFIVKNQKDRKGVFGGYKGQMYAISFRVELTNEEKELVEKYQVHDEPITWKETKEGREPSIRIGELISGLGYESSNIFKLMTHEDEIKAGCQQFKGYLEIMRTFVGEETIDYVPQ